MTLKHVETPNVCIMHIKPTIYSASAHLSQMNSSQLILSIQMLLNSITLHIFKGLWLRTRSSWQGHVSSATFSDLPCLFLFPLKFKRYQITGCERHCFTFQTTICSRVSTQMPLCPLVWCLNWLVLHEKKKSSFVYPPLSPSSKPSQLNPAQ